MQPKGTSLAAGNRLHGFVVRSVTPLEDLRLRAIELEHERTGARVLHLQADDPENLFSVTFPTPPADDTGLPHIMEHSVLCGSRTYPVKSPYFEMRRMSMATFINAMTAPDFTLYPMASNVPADLMNLAAVCFDAVFHPLLETETFQTQAHHLEPIDATNPAGEWKHSGIVYNEMKGALSDPERLLYLLEQRRLVPDTTLARFSGGDPEAMPSLTYEDFLAFHRAHYHPSNAYFVLYGDIATERYTEFLEERLAVFERAETPPVIPAHPRWSEPRRAFGTYPVPEGEPTQGRALHLVSWLAGQAADPAQQLRWEILGQVVAADETAPIRRALIESGLATRLIAAGAFEIGPETIFRVAARGGDESRAEEYEARILDTLEKVAREGIDPGDIDSALRRTAYSHLEIGPLHPLQMMQRAVSGWIHGAQPLAHLQMGRLLDDLRAEWERDPDLFVRLIREGLLSNPHRLRATLAPEPGGAARVRDRARERMAEIEAGLDEAERERLAAEAERIRTEFAQPNPPEAIALLPQLGLDDLPRDPIEIETRHEPLGDRGELLVNEVFSNGIEYLRIDFDLANLPERLWPFLPRLGAALRKMGTERRGYREMARALAAKTGGLGFDLECLTHAEDPSRSVRSFTIGLRTLERHLPDALELVHELLFELDSSDLTRLGEITRESSAAMQSTFRRAGSFLAGGMCAARGWSVEDHLVNFAEGAPQLALLQRFAGSPVEELRDGIESVRAYLLACPFVTASFTGSPRGAEHVGATLTRWLTGLHPPAERESESSFERWEQPGRDGLACPIDVAHAAAVLSAPHASDPVSALIQLGGHLVKFGYLLPEIRFKGNAYGAEVVYHRVRSNWSVLSYRDPHLQRTLGVFEGMLEHVRGADWSTQEIQHAIIAQAKLDQRPIRPESATQIALLRHRLGLTPEFRRAHRARLLAATPADVQGAMLRFLEDSLPQSSVCVMASRERLEEANRELDGRALRIEPLDI